MQMMDCKTRGYGTRIVCPSPCGCCDGTGWTECGWMIVSILSASIHRRLLAFENLGETLLVRSLNPTIPRQQPTKDSLRPMTGLIDKEHKT